MDISIRGSKDGIETAREITQRYDIPIIFLTAYGDEGTLKKAAAVSPYGYLLKPFDNGTLKVTITVALERHAADARSRLLSAAVNSADIGIVLAECRPQGVRISLPTLLTSR